MLKLLLHCICQVFAFRSICVPIEFFCDNCSHHLFSLSKGRTGSTFQADRNDRIFAHVFFTKISLTGDLQPVKQRSVLSDFEETAQHIHIQRFAEAARAREQIYIPAILHQVRDKHCLIDIIKVAGTQLLEVFHTDRQFQFFLHSTVLLCSVNMIG